MTTTTRTLSTPDDIDTRWGTRRLLRDAYALHADAVDVIRVSLADSSRKYCLWMGESTYDGPDSAAAYWAKDLWMIERTCRDLGIDTRDI